MTTGPANPAAGALNPLNPLDTAIARGDLEVVTLRLLLGVIGALEDARAGAAATREELLALMSPPEGDR